MLVLICWKCSWLMNDFNQDLKSRGALLDAGDHWKPKTRHYYMRILFYWMIFLWLVRKKIKDKSMGIFPSSCNCEIQV